MSDDNNSDCADFCNAFGEGLASRLHRPSVPVDWRLVLWAVGAARRDRPTQKPLGGAQRLEQAYLAVGRDTRLRALQARRGRPKLILKGAVIWAALIAALFVVAVIAALIAMASHSDAAEIAPWVVSGLIPAFVVVWAKFCVVPSTIDALLHAPRVLRVWRFTRHFNDLTDTDLG